MCPWKTGEPFAEYVVRVLGFSGSTKMRVNKRSRDKRNNTLVEPSFPLRARRTDNFVSPHWTEHNPTFDAEYYPIAPVVSESSITPVVLTAGDPVAQVLRPGGTGEEHNLYALRIVASALAAGRDIVVRMTDGTDTVPIFATTAATWASGEDFLVYPVDVSTKLTGAVDLIGSPPLPSRRNQFLEAEAVGLIAAETFTLTPIFTSNALANGVQ